MNSPAIDHISIADCTDADGIPNNADQRGVSRPLDGDSNGSFLCAVGAFEVDRLQDCSGAFSSIPSIWPPNHKFVPVSVLLSDPHGNPTSVTIGSIFQDELVDTFGDGTSTPDGQGLGTGTAEIRAEASGVGDGRMYHIGFTANDGAGGSCSDEVLVGVPHDQYGEVGDGGALFDSTIP